jgi:hypothetical protein
MKRIDLMQHFKKGNAEGNLAVIQGSVGSGKSYFCNILTPYFIDAGFDIITNLKFDKSVFENNNIWYMSSDLTFFEAYTETNNKIIAIFDDFQATSGDSTTVTSKKGQSSKTFFIFIRKFGMNGVMVYHLDYLQKAIYQQRPLYLYKKDKKTFYASYQKYSIDKINPFMQDLKKNKIFRIRQPDIKPLPYNTYGFPSFKIYLDWDDIQEFMANWWGNNKDGMREYLRQWKNGERPVSRLSNATLKEIYNEVWNRRKDKFTLHEFRTAQIRQVFPSSIYNKH